MLLQYPKCCHCSEPFQNLISVRTRKTLLIPRLRKANILFKVKGVFRLNSANGTKHNMNKSIKTSSVIDDKHLFALRQLAKTLAMGQGLAGLICGTAVTSQYLATSFHVDTPMLQSFFNYTLLCATYTSMLLCRRGNTTTHRLNTRRIPVTQK